MKKIILMVTMIFVLMIMVGCNMYTGQTRQVLASNAITLRMGANLAASGIYNPTTAIVNPDKNLADNLLMAGIMDPLKAAWYLECAAEAAQNLKDSGDWNKPTFPVAPIKPTVLPWTPQFPVTTTAP